MKPYRKENAELRICIMHFFVNRVARFCEFQSLYIYEMTLLRSSFDVLLLANYSYADEIDFLSKLCLPNHSGMGKMNKLMFFDWLMRVITMKYFSNL